MLAVALERIEKERLLCETTPFTLLQYERIYIEESSEFL